MHLGARLAFAVAALAVAQAPAAAQTAQTPQTAQNAKPARDPNEVVCEKQNDPGSRLVAAKVCHTRAEWSDLRSQDRQELDRVQTRRGLQH
jgi:invasion protein IalB